MTDSRDTVTLPMGDAKAILAVLGMLEGRCQYEAEPARLKAYYKLKDAIARCETIAEGKGISGRLPVRISPVHRCSNNPCCAV